jgi:hypothetical protein
MNEWRGEGVTCHLAGIGVQLGCTVARVARVHGTRENTFARVKKGKWGRSLLYHVSGSSLLHILNDIIREAVQQPPTSVKIAAPPARASQSTPAHSQTARQPCARPNTLPASNRSGNNRNNTQDDCCSYDVLVFRIESEGERTKLSTIQEVVPACTE